MAITGFQASEAISADDAVYVTSLGFIARALGTGLSTAAAAGVAIDSGAAGARRDGRDSQCAVCSVASAARHV